MLDFLFELERQKLVMSIFSNERVEGSPSQAATAPSLLDCIVDVANNRSGSSSEVHSSRFVTVADRTDFRNINMPALPDSPLPHQYVGIVKSLLPGALSGYLLVFEGPENFAIPLIEGLELFYSGDEATMLARVRNELFCSHRLYWIAA